MRVSIGGGSILSGSLLSDVATVALSLVGVAAASAIAIVSGAAAEVAVVAASTATSLRAASILALLRRGKTSASVRLRLEFAIALVVVSLASLLLALLGWVIFSWFSARDPARRSRARLGELGAWNSATGTAKAVGPNILSTVAHNVSSTAFVLTLEMQGSSQTTSTRRAVSTGGLAWGLDGAEVSGG